MTDDARIAVKAGEAADQLVRLMIAQARMGELTGIVGSIGLRKIARDMEGLAAMLHARADQIDGTTTGMLIEGAVSVTARPDNAT